MAKDIYLDHAEAAAGSDAEESLAVQGITGGKAVSVTGPNPNVVDVILSLDTSAYGDGDVLAATQEIASFFRVAGGTGTIISIDVLDEDKQSGALDILLFDSNVDVGTENGAYAITDAEMRSKVGEVDIIASYYNSRTEHSTCFRRLGDYGFNTDLVKAAAGSTSLWIAAISRDAKTYSAAGIRLKIKVYLD